MSKLDILLTPSHPSMKAFHNLHPEYIDEAHWWACTVVEVPKTRKELRAVRRAERDAARRARRRNK